ncbi:hypothetical protein ALC62_01043 [Cyphomyrmex costatus]|uniref:Regulatory protein zeste n=1 Tax=Cyphomyrmex costatus TaxID=456900 RepID=A0A151IPN0_9HYME|nr:hypothetical protein ALC62_01043 [Cyphomyrmex costatus]
MESHSEFAAGKFLGKEGKLHYAQQWERLTEILNSLSTGPGKTTKQWQTVWRDLKSNASKKAAKIRYERNRTGNFPMQSQMLDDLEQRIIACIGLDYVQGSQTCPDSTPEEENYQLELEKGNEEVLYYPPQVSSIADVLPRNDDTNNDDNQVHEENMTFEDIITLDNYQETNDNIENVTFDDVRHTFEDNVQANTSKSKGKNKTHSLKASRNKEIVPQTNYGRKNRQRISAQLHEAREKFTEIAKNHATALQKTMDNKYNGNNGDNVR